MGDSAGASRHYTKGKVLVGDKEKENGVGVLSFNIPANKSDLDIPEC
jgi:hypothetical protein